VGREGGREDDEPAGTAAPAAVNLQLSLLAVVMMMKAAYDNRQVVIAAALLCVNCVT